MVVAQAIQEPRNAANEVAVASREAPSEEDSRVVEPEFIGLVRAANPQAEGDPERVMSTKRVCSVALVGIGASLFWGCDLFESPTEPEDPEELTYDPTEDPGEDDGDAGDPPAEDPSTCFERVETGSPAGLDGCNAGSRCNVRLVFQNNCSRAHQVTARWAAYNDGQLLRGVGPDCGFVGGSYSLYFESGTPAISPGETRDHRTCFHLHEDTTHVALRWRIGKFDDDDPPAPIDGGDPVQPDWEVN